MSVRSYQHGNPYPLDGKKSYNEIREYPFALINISDGVKSEAGSGPTELSKIMANINKTAFNAIA